MPILETSRLILRPFSPSDYPALRAFHADPVVERYERSTPTKEETHSLLARCVSDEKETPRHHYAFAVTIRPEDTVHGRLSLQLNNESVREWETGWMLNQSYWGQGYASEAATRAPVCF